MNFVLPLCLPLAAGYEPASVDQPLDQHKPLFENKNFKHFVWINGLSGPEAQIWSDEGGRDSQGKLKPSLKCVQLPEHDTRMLDELKKDYPYEGN